MAKNGKAWQSMAKNGKAWQSMAGGCNGEKFSFDHGQTYIIIV